MRLYCPECCQRLGGFDELCRHRNPVGECCCPDTHTVASYGNEWDEDGDQG